MIRKYKLSDLAYFVTQSWLVMMMVFYSFLLGWWLDWWLP